MPTRPTFRLFTIRYTKAYTPGPFAESIIIETRGLAIQPRILHNYKTRARTGLWISIMGNSSSVKRVVRNHVTRKVRRAFTEALARSGYDADGRGVGRSLMGSISFWALKFQQCLLFPRELEGEMARLVAWLEKQQ